MVGLDLKKGFLSCASGGIDGVVFLITIKQTASINRGCRFPMQTMLYWDNPVELNLELLFIVHATVFDSTEI